MSKRKEFLIKQGYSKHIVEFVFGCGVTKHMLWFINQIIKNNFELNNNLKQNIIIINKFFNNSRNNSFLEFDLALDSAKNFLKKELEREKNILHVFSDGYYIIKILPEDLVEEGKDMHNCVADFEDEVLKKRTSILALKSNRNKTISHFQVGITGLLIQCYEKFNKEVMNKNWKYINEFFDIYHKKIDFDKFFGLAWSLDYNVHKGEVKVSCTIPVSVITMIDNNSEKTYVINDFLKLKTFYLNIPEFNCRNEYNKEVIINELDNFKNSLNNQIDELVKNIKTTDHSKFYLSDDIKKKIFGKNFKLKGDKIDFHDLIFDVNEEYEDDGLYDEIENNFMNIFPRNPNELNEFY